ncbi:hypothetical protein Lser_V15G04712 [Lactuca serriola]
MADDHDVDHTVIPSSSAEEDSRSRNQSPMIRNSRKRKQPVDQISESEKGEVQEDMECQQETSVIKKLWSVKDEITLLETLKQISNKSDMNMLYEIVKPYLEEEFSEDQVSEKVSWLKTNFMNNNSKDALQGTSSSHDAKIRELYKEIWGESETAVVGPREMTIKEFQGHYPRFSASIEDLPPYNKISDEGKAVIIACMLHMQSRMEFEEIEDKLMKYCARQVKRAEIRLLLSKKLSELLQKGTRAYHRRHQD